MPTKVDAGVVCCSILLALLVIGGVVAALSIYGPFGTGAICDENVTLGQEFRDGDDYIGIVFAGCPTVAQREVFQKAASRWSRIITDNRIAPSKIGAVGLSAKSACSFVTNSFRFEAGLEIDHLIIIIDIQDIDGVGGTLGQSAPCVFDDAGTFPIISGLVFENSDLRRFKGDSVENFAMHEMAHSLGFGTVWLERNLLRNPIFENRDVNVNNVPIFVGESAVDQYDDLLSGVQLSVPVEDGRIDGEFSTFHPDENPNSGRGSIDAHWKKENFGDELMIFSLRRESNLLPISKVTLGSLEDLGYEVDFSQADDFELASNFKLAKSNLRGNEEILVHDVVIEPLKQLKDLN